MSHLSTIGASIYSDLSVCTDDTLTTAAIGSPVELNFNKCFAADKYERISDVREFPSIGTPPNIVNVPVYGQATSKQIQGQADAPSIEITINYVAELWKKDADLGKLVNDQKQHIFRFSLLNKKPPSYDYNDPAQASELGMGGDTSEGTATENSFYFWIGKIEALIVNPQLTDATTATLTISTQSDFYGVYTLPPRS
jgi:hypothetical protein